MGRKGKENEHVELKKTKKVSNERKVEYRKRNEKGSKGNNRRREGMVQT